MYEVVEGVNWACDPEHVELLQIGEDEKREPVEVEDKNGSGMSAGICFEVG